ncbi:MULTISPECIES: GFA family protein [unclassified Roseovarius]|uniref:GFA family protein n=1 Tax=unclassified Roseovarius TaxID=2614913 RepID=UPI00273D37E5|nr:MULTISPECIES: GFA family protein [unclassified Roseovarius]
MSGAQPPQAMTGGCLCGAVRYTLHQKPKQIDVCHCGMCRKFSGGIELGVDVDPDKIDWQGEENIEIYASSEWAERSFCRICGSGLFWRTRAKDWDAEPLFGLCAGAIDDLGDLDLKTEIYIDQKPAGYAFAGQTDKKTQAEAEAAFAFPTEGGGR